MHGHYIVPTNRKAKEKEECRLTQWRFRRIDYKLQDSLWQQLFSLQYVGKREFFRSTSSFCLHAAQNIHKACLFFVGISFCCAPNMTDISRLQTQLFQSSYYSLFSFYLNNIVFGAVGGSEAWILCNVFIYRRLSFFHTRPRHGLGKNGRHPCFLRRTTFCRHNDEWCGY